MGEYLRSIGKMIAMQVENGGTEMRAVEEVTTSFSASSSKRRKVDDFDSELVILPSNDSVSEGSASAANSATSSPFTTLEELSDVEKDNMKSTDLKRKDSETEISTFNIVQFSRETSPSSELCRRDSGEFMESSSTTKKKKSSPRNSQLKHSVAETPSAAEIEEFFSKAEKHEQKRFAEKYNYDTVKDAPLEGRYQWIRLKP